MDQPVENSEIEGLELTVEPTRKLFLTISAALLVILVVASVGGYLWAQKLKNNLGLQKNSSDKAVAYVANIKISQKDLDEWTKIANGQANYQQTSGATASAKIKSRQEVLDELVTVTKIKIAAKRLGISVSDEEIQAGLDKAGGKVNLLAGLKKLGWGYDDWKNQYEITLLSQKIRDKVVKWRIGEFDSVRWDVTPRKSEVDYFKPKAKAALELVKDKFANGEDVVKISQELRDKNLPLGVFNPSSFQYVKYNSDISKRYFQQVTVANAGYEWNEHIMDLSAGTKDDIWCSDYACYLTRVLEANDGKYNSLEEYLNAEIK